MASTSGAPDWRSSAAAAAMIAGIRAGRTRHRVVETLRRKALAAVLHVVSERPARHLGLQRQAAEAIAAAWQQHRALYRGCRALRRGLDRRRHHGLEAGVRLAARGAHLAHDAGLLLAEALGSGVGSVRHLVEVHRIEIDRHRFLRRFVDGVGHRVGDDIGLHRVHLRDADVVAVERFLCAAAGGRRLVRCLLHPQRTEHAVERHRPDQRLAARRGSSCSPSLPDTIPAPATGCGRCGRSRRCPACGPARLGIAACSSGVTQDSAGIARLSGINISFLEMSLPLLTASSQALRTSTESGVTSLPSWSDSFFASSRFQLSETLNLKKLFALVT